MAHTGVLCLRLVAAQDLRAESISINGENVRGGCGVG